MQVPNTAVFILAVLQAFEPVATDLCSMVPAPFLPEAGPESAREGLPDIRATNSARISPIPRHLTEAALLRRAAPSGMKGMIVTVPKKVAVEPLAWAVFPLPQHKKVRAALHARARTDTVLA